MRRPPSFAGIAPPLGSASALRSARSSTRSSHATRRQKSPRLLRLRCASPWARTPLRVVLLLLDFVTTRGDDHNKNSLPPVRWSGHSFTCSISISVHVVFGARAPVAVAPTAHGRAGGRALIHRGGDQEIHPPQTRRSRLEIKRRDAEDHPTLLAEPTEAEVRAALSLHPLYRLPSTRGLAVLVTACHSVDAACPRRQDSPRTGLLTC